MDKLHDKTHKSKQLPVAPAPREVTPTPLAVAPAPREAMLAAAAARDPLRACPRWDSPSGVVVIPGEEQSFSFGSNLAIAHEIVVLDEDGSVVAGVTFTPNPVTPSGDPLAASVTVKFPAEVEPGNYYLQVRIPPPDTATNFSHTIELFIEEAQPLDVQIVPQAGSEPGMYTVGAKITLDSAVTGGTGTYTYNWQVNGATVSTDETLETELNTPGTATVTLDVVDSDGDPGSSDPLDYTVVSAAFEITAVRQEPAGAVPTGTDVSFFATFAGGTAPYGYTLTIDEETLSGSAPAAGEVLIGTHTFKTEGTFTGTLQANDAAGATADKEYTVEVTK